jgi:AcrR family transcriptional regulator
MAARPNKAGKGGTARQRRRRLSPDDRERMIVEGAIRYFAANGIDGDTRALARSLGVSQPLIFHYFPTKDALINRVYQELFYSRWRPEWDEILGDRGRPLRRRLKEFYASYFAAADRPEWIRITLYAALRDIEVNARYHARVRERIIHRIVRELRHELKLGDPDEAITFYEEQIVYTLHAGIFYQMTRAHVYKMPAAHDVRPVLDVHIDLFMDAIPAALRRLLSEQPRHPVAAMRWSGGDAHRIRAIRSDALPTPRAAANRPRRRAGAHESR